MVVDWQNNDMLTIFVLVASLTHFLQERNDCVKKVYLS